MLFAVSAVVAFGCGLVAAPASVTAAPRSGHDRVTVPFAGTTTFDFSTPGCPFAHQVIDAGTGGGAGFGRLHLDGCVALGAGFTFTGSFLITTRRGEVAGTVSGPIVTPSSGSCATGLVPGTLTFTLTPTSGTKAFRHDTSPISLVGTWCSPAVPGVAGPVTGTLNAEGARVSRRG
jgi:hypothetical protein